MKKIVFIALITLSLMSGCNDSKEVITALEKDLSTVSKENQENLVLIEQLKDDKAKLIKEIEETQSTFDQYQELDKNDYIENQYYREHEVQTIVGFRYYGGKEPIRIFPYEEAPAIKDVSGLTSNVRILSVVRNTKDQDWALIEYLNTNERFGVNNYGYVKVELLEECKEDAFQIKNFPIRIEGITIGDRIEQAIATLGRDYIEVNGFNGGFIHYGGTDGESGFATGIFFRDGVDVFSKGKEDLIWGIRVQVEGYETEAGFGVGDNAREAVDYYKKKYKMNGEEKFDKYFVLSDTAFELNNGYYLEFKIDTEELNESSIITGIEIFPLGWGIG